ncbi:substrate-binding periplasmic protein [Shewanella sp. A14]
MLRFTVIFITFVIMTPTSIANTAKEKVIFYTETYPPFQSRNHQGKLTGFAIDILQTSQQYLDFDIDIQIMPWSRAYRNAKKNPNTFIFSIGKTEQRLKSFKWVDNFYTVQDAIYKKASRTDINITNLSDIDRYSLALSRDDVALERLNINHQYANIYIVSNQITALKMLNFDRVDLIYNNEIGFKEVVNLLGLEQRDFIPAFIAHQIDVGLATHKDTRIDLLNKMKQAMKTMRKNNEFDDIVAKWFPKSRPVNIIDTTMPGQHKPLNPS